jgi:subtilisin family serine protease
MATPHVAATAALVLSQMPTLTPAVLEHLLEATALDLGAPGKDNTYGFGLVQAGAALRGQGIVK